jgi:adenylate kinase family enzyme
LKVTYEHIDAIEVLWSQKKTRTRVAIEAHHLEAGATILVTDNMVHVLCVTEKAVLRSK